MRMRVVSIGVGIKRERLLLFEVVVQERGPEIRSQEWQARGWRSMRSSTEQRIKIKIYKELPGLAGQVASKAKRVRRRETKNHW